MTRTQALAGSPGMPRIPFRMCLVGVSTVAALGAQPRTAVAQDGGAVVVQDVRRLGGSTAFYRTPLTNVASLKRMSDDPRVVANIRTVLDQGGVGSLADRVVAAFTGATASVVGGRCADATPAEGVIVECDVQPGQTLQWMAHRPRGTAPALLQNIRWAGARPFRAYLFRVTEGDRTYTFVVPKVCGNVSLLSMEEKRVPVAATVVEPPFVAPPPPAVAPVLVESPPPPPPTFEQPAAPMIATTAVRRTPFFVDGLFGKERRTRPVEGAIDAAQCSPMAGVKFGVSKRFDNDWELGGTAGVAVGLTTADERVREDAFFVEVEGNRYLGRHVFVGVGVSMWDLSHSDTITPAAMVHVGLPIAPNARFPV